MDERGISAEEIDPQRRRRFVQRLADQGRLFGKRRRNQADGRHRYPLVDNGDTVFSRELGRGLYDLFRAAAYEIVNVFRRLLRGAPHAGKQGKPHGNRADVEMLPLDHVDGFQNVELSKHALPPFKRCASR